LLLVVIVVNTSGAGVSGFGAAWFVFIPKAGGLEIGMHYVSIIKALTLYTFYKNPTTIGTTHTPLDFIFLSL
jgi:hypothetical protein